MKIQNITLILSSIAIVLSGFAVYLYFNNGGFSNSAPFLSSTQRFNVNDIRIKTIEDIESITVNLVYGENETVVGTVSRTEESKSETEWAGIWCATIEPIKSTSDLVILNVPTRGCAYPVYYIFDFGNYDTNNPIILDPIAQPEESLSNQGIGEYSMIIDGLDEYLVFTSGRYAETGLSIDFINSTPLFCRVSTEEVWDIRISNGILSFTEESLMGTEPYRKLDGRTINIAEFCDIEE